MLTHRHTRQLGIASVLLGAGPAYVADQTWVADQHPYTALAILVVLLATLGNNRRTKVTLGLPKV